MGLEIRLKWTHIFGMISYVIGIIFFISTAQYVNAMLMGLVAYWSNMAWFYEGKSHALWALLKEAKDIMEGKEPVSIKESNNE